MSDAAAGRPCASLPFALCGLLLLAGQLQHMNSSTVIQLHPHTQWSLGTAIDLALEQHWKGTRKEASATSWCRMFLETFPDKTLATLTTRDISTYISMMQVSGLGSWTVHARVCVISTLYTVAKRNGYTGPVPTIPRPRIDKPLKWWLKPDDELLVVAWLGGAMLQHQAASFIRWTACTGLRIEESLRVVAGDFLGLDTLAPEMTVPGTKTATAQAALALSSEAARLARSLLGENPRNDTPLFTINYHQLERLWLEVRKQFGWTGISTATLKAIRRSYARRLTAQGCPLPVLQQMMRHEDPETTLGYMRLVGGSFTTEEQRKWL